MSNQPSRRRFLLGSVSSGIALTAFNVNSLLSVAEAQENGSLSPSVSTTAEDRGVDFDYLSKGLTALARAHRSNTMAGHLGAAVIAGHFISEQHGDLDEVVYRGIEKELDRIIAGESVFSPRSKTGISVPEMFQPFPNEAPDKSLVDGIAEALAGNIDRTRQSGHNVIFASSAIRALKLHPEFCTPSIAEGIRKLIAAFDGASPGSGYYGQKKGRMNGRRVDLTDQAELARYTDVKSMAETVLEHLIAHGNETRIGYGGLTHLINHAAALVELENFGYSDLAAKGLAAHHEHLKLWRSLPDVADEPGKSSPKPSPDDPRTAAFWRSGNLPTGNAKLTHRIKTLYGFDALVTVIPNHDQRESGNQNLRYLM